MDEVGEHFLFLPLLVIGELTYPPIKFLKQSKFTIMKIGKKIKSAETPIYEPMPREMRLILKDLSINEAIEKGFITDLGDSEGKFVFEHADVDVDAYYGIVNGYTVKLSASLKDEADNIDDILGRLRFTLDISTVEGGGKGKEYFVLGLPRGLRLGNSVYAIKEELLEA